MLLSSVRANNNTPFLFSPASFPHPREIRAGHGGQDAKAGARRHPQPGGESVQGAGGSSTLALPTPAAPLPRPCLRRAHPGPPRQGVFQCQCYGVAPPPAPPSDARRFPRCSPTSAASGKHLRSCPRARRAPSVSARAWRTETASLPHVLTADQRRASPAGATHLGSGAALPPPQTSADK